MRFGLTGPLRYSMDGRDAAELIGCSSRGSPYPVHYEGWSHFSEPQQRLRTALAAAPPPIRDALRWLEPGVTATV